LLAVAAHVALARLGLSERESLLVASNPDFSEIAAALTEAGHARTKTVRNQEFLPTSRDGEEPPPVVATAMRQASTIAIVTRFSLSHTEAG
jgi:hypothetical protein